MLRSPRNPPSPPLPSHLLNSIQRRPEHVPEPLVPPFTLQPLLLQPPPLMELLPPLIKRDAIQAQLPVELVQRDAQPRATKLNRPPDRRPRSYGSLRARHEGDLTAVAGDLLLLLGVVGRHVHGGEDLALAGGSRGGFGAFYVGHVG